MAHTPRHDFIAYYRAARAHQLKTYGKDGLHIDGVDQKRFTGGGAAYGYHAIDAYGSAKRSNFARRMAN